MTAAVSRNIPRLEWDELDAGLQETLRPRVERLKYLGEFFRCMGHQPAALSAFIEFTETAKAALDKRTIEIIALTVATLRRNRYECNQHERLSVRLGFGRDWVRQVESLTPENSPLLEPHERALQRFVITSVETNGSGAADQLSGIVAHYGPDRAVAILMVIGRYVTHALIVNTLSLAPPVPSIFEDGFDGSDTPRND